MSLGTRLERDAEMLEFAYDIRDALEILTEARVFARHNVECQTYDPYDGTVTESPECDCGFEDFKARLSRALGDE